MVIRHPVDAEIAPPEQVASGSSAVLALEELVGFMAAAHKAELGERVQLRVFEKDVQMDSGLAEGFAVVSS